MKKSRLFTPGPTDVPQEVLETLARPLVHHRTDIFRKTYTEVIENLRLILSTRNPTVVLTSSGTGAMEAAVVNLTQPGEKVVVTVLGKFSERWRVIAETYQLKVIAVEVEWGDPVTPAQLEETLEQHPDTSVVFTTHSETSTGVLQDVGAFASIAAGHGALLAVDAISSAAAHEIKTDEWGLDAVVGGAQKGTMVPPGLSFLSLSQKAVTKMKAGRHPCYYFDLLAAVEKAAKGDTPYTPATPLVFALHKALEMILEEGLENVFERHRANADAVRAAVTAIGLELLASVPCNATTPVLIPGEKAGEVILTMEEKYGVKVAGGQLRLKGKIVRLGHLGHYNSTDMYTMISAFESALNDLGIVDSFGAGVDALRGSYARNKT